MVDFIDYAWLIPILPALAALVVAFLGRFTPEKGGWIAVALVGLAGLLSLLLFFDATSGKLVTSGAPATLEHGTFEWWSVGDYAITFGLYVDDLTAFMLFIVGILVTLIVMYSIGYMHEEGTARRRYYAEMALFITGMLGLVLANNYLMLFVFWEIMGLCSYLLIGYWFTKPSAAAAAKKAFLVTRIGDMFLMAGLGILLVKFGSLDFDVLFTSAAALDGTSEEWILQLANVCILLGAVGKSAQFPLHVWLPDAMEGPTTVSALIHAATMVKAGVYLVARSLPLFVLTPEVLIATAVIGGFTALFAASMALTNWDLKRVLAYSTLSQLGYMFLGLGIAGAVGTDDKVLLYMALVFTAFHLFAHAFFKAGLFLSAGAVGHAVHTYDMRAMGGLRKHMPITAATMLVGAISIAGVPPFSGFYSKDALLEGVFHAASENPIFYLLYGMAVLTAFMTAYYMFRLYFLTFEGDYRGPGWRGSAAAASLARPGHHAGHEEHATGHGAGHEEHHEVHLHEAPATMTVPLAILAVFAVFGAIIMFFLLPGGAGFVAGNFAGDDLAAAAQGSAEGKSAGLDWHGAVSAITHPFSVPLTYVSIAAAVGGIALAFVMWGPGKATERLVPDEAEAGATRVLNKRYYIDNVYDAAAYRGVYGLGRVTAWFDAYVIDGIVNGVAWANQRGSQWWRRTQTGNVQDYAMTLIAGLAILILLIVYGVVILNFLKGQDIISFVLSPVVEALRTLGGAFA